MNQSSRESTQATATETVYRALRAFAERLSRPTAPPDGLLSARVIGEFSAGKTRLLRELLGEAIPPALFPVSSLERQTRLPLEITYGEPPALTLIERANDYDAAIPVETLHAFPRREELADRDPLRYRLQLTVPEPRLFLPTGDRYGEDDREPKRLLLIDLPGWNSGEDALAESAAAEIMTGYHNLALVFVVAANRLDGQQNTERLREFLAALADADFVGEPTLILVITHCPPADQARLGARLRARVAALWRELDEVPEALRLYSLAVDFADLTPDELAAFRETFWGYLLAPLQDGSQAEPQAAHPWIAGLRHWSGESDPRAHLPLAQARIEEARALLARACPGGEFLPGMNMHRLLGLDAAALRERLLTVWRRQLECPDAEQLAARLATPVPLPDDHPLAAWWGQYWQANLERALAPARQFFARAEAVLGQVQPETPELRAYLAGHLSEHHRAGVQALDSSFACLVESAQALVAETPPERATATLLSLSLLEARYTDHEAWARGNR